MAAEQSVPRVWVVQYRDGHGGWANLSQHPTRREARDRALALWRQYGTPYRAARVAAIWLSEEAR